MTKRAPTRSAMIAASLLATAVVLSVVVWAWSARRDQGVVRAPIASESIVMLGDSITEQGPWSTAFAELPIANRGYSGSTTADLLEAASDAARARPHAVFVLTGTNDIRDGHPPSWTVRHLASILDEFATSAPETSVVIQTILPRADHRLEVIEANAAIVRLAKERGVAILDLHTTFDDGSGALRPEDTVDGLHLSEIGNRRWADLLKSEFEP